MKIENNAFVTLGYELEVDGEIVDKTTDDKPLEFIYGAGFLLPAFEKKVEGLQEGENFEFRLSPEEGYGSLMDDTVVELPKTAFMVDGKIEEGMLEAGNQIPMMDNQGNQMIGTVKEVKDDAVLMDFNHPLAGKELHFSGKITGVREATDVDRAKFMGMGGGCGCGCGDHDCDEGKCESDCGCN